jgi:hypothetical protein
MVNALKGAGRDLGIFIDDIQVLGEAALPMEGFVFFGVLVVADKFIEFMFAIMVSPDTFGHGILLLPKGFIILT